MSGSGDAVSGGGVSLSATILLSSYLCLWLVYLLSKRFSCLHAAPNLSNRFESGFKPHTEAVSRKRFANRFGGFTLKALWQEALSKRFRRYV